MNDIDSIKRNLNLFVEKAEKLNKLSFTKIIRESKTGVTISSKRREEGDFETTSERRGPNEEFIDAFVLTFRFFLQNNEPCSIANLEKCYSSKFLGGDFLKEYQDIRLALNGYLDDTHDIRVEENGRILSRREMMETFLHGDLAHTNSPEKRNRFLNWTSDQSSQNLFMNEFVVIISRVLIAINWLKDLNERALLKFG